MLVLTLLHPRQNTVSQVWKFREQPSIRIGRSRKNDVTLYSTVVSRQHAILRRTKSGWEFISYGTNGSFIGERPIRRVAIANGMIIRLANSGPRLQIWTHKPTSTSPRQKTPPNSTSTPSQPATAHKETLTESRAKLTQEEIEVAKSTYVDLST